MSDLISRKALLKQFIVSDSGRRIPEYDCDNFPITISIKDVKDIIRKAPTAFDKEKVIEELEYDKEMSAKYSTGLREQGHIEAFDEAISIVKKGGINNILL